MDAEYWGRVEKLFYSVLAEPVERRAAVLEASCSNDPELLHDLKSLLEAREEADGFLSPEKLCGYITDLCDDGSPTRAGSNLGPYQILDQIGAGSMGEVYRARDTRLDRLVALKVLPAHLTHDTARIARFRLEAKAASALNHPNIVTIYEVGQTDGTWFIAEELVDGLTLRDRLATGKLALPEALDIVIQSATALQTAHAAGILHRDIKPENIMVRPDGLIKIVDFGLAQIAQVSPEWSPHATGVGNIIGTPRYMSPEQARGQKLDPRSDIFSLAAVLYELVEGCPALPGATPPEIFAVLLGPEPIATPQNSGTQLNRVLSKALRKDSQSRYQTMEAFANDLKSADLHREPSNVGWRNARHIGPRLAIFALAALLLVGAAVGLFFQLRHKPAFTVRDRILLSDFVNKTGDSVFDGTLKQGLAVQLEQSPYLNVFPDARVAAVMRLMRRPPGAPVTHDIALEICRREGIKALVVGSIVPLGSHYAITLEALDSRQSETLARIQVEAESKERVLHALSRAAAGLREKLGESLRSIQQFDALLERTTGSIEALRAYSLGHEIRTRGNFLAAIPFFQNAVELDPDFAYAWVDLATCYRNTRQPGLAAEYSTKAYRLRDRVSERERLGIMSQYCDLVTGDLDKRLEILKLYQSIYPRDATAHLNLAVTYEMMGQYDLAVEESRVAIQLDPNSAARQATFINSLVHLNHFAEARLASERAHNRKLDDASIHQNEYRMAFMNHDNAAMDQQLQWAANRKDSYIGLDWQAGTAAYLGQWKQSNVYAQRSVEAAIRSEANEVAASYLVENALRAAVLGQCAETKVAAARALEIVHTPISLTRASLALAWCGDTGAPARLMDELNKRYPRHTVVNRIWIPAIRAAIDLKRNHAESAVDALEPTVHYEAAAEFWPQYLRANAYLQLRRASLSAAEFRKILSNRGQKIDSVLYPLAYLGLARAALLETDSALARKSSGDFFTTWANADPDLLLLRSFRQEFKKLSSETGK